MSSRCFDREGNVISINGYSLSYRVKVLSNYLTNSWADGWYDPSTKKVRHAGQTWVPVLLSGTEVVVRVPAETVRKRFYA